MVDCVANWEMILKYLTVVLNWPAVALVCAIVAMLQFKAPISEVIRKFRKATGPGGLAVEVDAQAALPAPGQQLQPPAPGRDAPPPGGPTYWDLAKWFVHEKRLNIIMGSQLSLLEALETRAEGLSNAERETLFALHRRDWPSTTLTVADWLRWLVEQSLIRITGEGDAQRTILHEGGREFLNYLRQYYRRIPLRMG